MPKGKGKGKAMKGAPRSATLAGGMSWVGNMAGTCWNMENVVVGFFVWQ